MLNTYGYTFDGIGNRTDRNYAANSVNQYKKNPDAADADIDYDLRGNMTTDGVFDFTWNSANQLTSATPKTVVTLEQETTAHEQGNDLPASRKVEFGYDDSGRRIWKKSYVYSSAASTWLAKETRKFVYDGNNLVAEFVVDPNGMDRLSRTYAWGKGIAGSVGGLLSITTFTDDGSTPTATYIPLYDDRGNVVGLASATDGKLVAVYQYDPFGKLIGEAGDKAVLDANPFGFNTMYTDRETELVWFQPGGYYSPALQRRLSREPAGEGESANLYVMFHNDPINRVDPDGFDDVPVSSYFSLTLDPLGREPLEPLPSVSYQPAGIPPFTARITAYPQHNGGTEVSIRYFFQDGEMVTGIGQRSVYLPPDSSVTVGQIRGTVSDVMNGLSNTAAQEGKVAAMKEARNLLLMSAAFLPVGAGLSAMGKVATAGGEIAFLYKATSLTFTAFATVGAAQGFGQAAERYAVGDSEGAAAGLVKGTVNAGFMGLGMYGTLRQFPSASPYEAPVSKPTWYEQGMSVGDEPISDPIDFTDLAGPGRNPAASQNLVWEFRTMNDPLPRVKGGFADGRPLPDPRAGGSAHTVLGMRQSPTYSPTTYRQAATFFEDGRIFEIHFSDHGAPWPQLGENGHIMPHIHDWTSYIGYPNNIPPHLNASPLPR